MLPSAILAVGAIAGAGAQPAAPPPAADIERMVRDGMLEALDSRLAGSRKPDDVRLLAHAATHKAARARDERQRQAAFEEAQRRFEAWIAAAAANGEPEQRALGAATARLELGNMILGRWVAPDLDELELYDLRKGDAQRATTLLRTARRAYEAALHDLEPLARRLEEHRGDVEERYLVLGVYDALPRVRLDLRYNLAWTLYNLARIDSANIEQRANCLGLAEQSFRELLEQGLAGDSAARCRLGLALVLRELGRLDEADSAFRTALAESADRPQAAQVRVEKARCEIAAGRFEEARRTLTPLVEKDPDQLAAADRPIRYYVSLAHVWYANSYLLEADRIAGGRQAPGREAERRSAAARDAGMMRFNQLAARGGPWPGLVAAYITSAVRSDADIKTLSPAELLYSARRLSDERKYGSALARLNEALARPGIPPEMMGEILFDIGLCHYQLRDYRSSAEAFERLVQQLATHGRASQAAVYSYQLRSSIADESRTRDDYIRLAEVLSTFLSQYPRHERRDEAAWWLPVAWQSAGEYARAIELYRAVPAVSIRWEEAQYRAALCARLLYETQRESMNDASRAAAAAAVAADLDAYAKAALTRADSTRDPRQVRGWAAAALVAAAELRASADLGQSQVALDALADFEKRFPDSDLTGRVLATRINAYRGLRRFDEATRVVAQYLQAVPTDQAGGVLAGVAAGMQAEVDRLLKAGEANDARRIADDAIAVFEQLDAWVLAAPQRQAHRDAVQYGLARMLWLAGRYDAARGLVDALVAKEPQNGAYQRLLAQVRTAALPEGASPAQLAEARAAWETILRDPTLLSTRPDAYWEARYEFLSLLLREGRTADVTTAIQQDEVWHPELGGPVWRPRLLALRERAATP